MERTEQLRLLTRKTELANADTLTDAEREELASINARMAEPIGTCDECGATTYVDSPRPWACSSRCYGDAMGICWPDY